MKALLKYNWSESCWDLGLWTQPITHWNWLFQTMETGCLFTGRVSSSQITSLPIMKERRAPLREGRLRNGPMRGPTEPWCSLLHLTTACCLKFGSVTVKGSCKYLVTSHVISPLSYRSPSPHAYGNPAPAWMLAENAVCQMGANPEPTKGFVLGLSLGSEFKTSIQSHMFFVTYQ